MVYVWTHTGERCVVQVLVHVGTARWERGKIASISCSSTTTPASKSQLVCATIPEYDLCLQLGEAKTPEGEKSQNWADDCMTILHFLMHLQQHQQLLESEEPH